MTYYLKYRPQKIAELDLAAVREALTAALKGKSFPHAWLFAGPKGTGKTSSARIVAKSINCLKRNGVEPCNRCDHCRAITAGTALDVLEIDAASNRGIDDIRAIKDIINLAPVKLKYKVYIIDEAHMLTREAYNALLKTLEEPPPYVLFILATTEPAKLPETVVSRCLVVKFNQASPVELLRSLNRVVKGEKIKVKEEKLKEIAASSEGSFRDAVKLLEFPDELKALKLDDWLVLVYQGQTKAAIDWLQQAWKEGAQPRQLTVSLIERLRQVFLRRLGLGEAEDIAALADLGAIKSLLGRLITAAGDLKVSPIESLPLELAVAEWCQSGPLPEKPVPAAVPSGLKQRWPQVLAAVKPLNHSLEALLKAAEPAGFNAGFLEVKVFYPFHKEKLEEERYRRLVEEAAGRVWGKAVKIRYFLGQKQTDIIKSAQEVFGVEVS